MADREAETMEARSRYLYRQTVHIEEMSDRGGRAGEYKEIREVIFLPNGERSEKAVGRPVQSLVRLRLTEEDFQDIRDVQPFLFTAEKRWMYEIRPRGEETMDGVDCWVIDVRPRQTFAGQRLFEGLMWVDKGDFSVVRSEGVAVPQILSTKQENLFPRFTTVRVKVDGKFRFPVYTFSDDTLHFRGGSIRQRMTIRYENYRRFAADSTVTFEKNEECK